MSSKSCCSQALPLRAISSFLRFVLGWTAAWSLCGFAATRALADAPAWMHALVNAPLPAHDEKTDAILLYAEDITSVQPTGKIKSIERRAYKVLRPNGRERGKVFASYDAETRITSIHGWCIPAQGKDYEVKDKDVIETAFFGVENGELATDVRTKVLSIPAPDPGNIIGWEIEHEDRPYILQDEWEFQRTVPVREARYTLQLPPGWEYKAVFLNAPEIKPTAFGSNQWQWVATNQEAIRPENDMPPWTAVAGMMVISFVPSGGAQNKGFENWNDMALWEAGLVHGRRNVSPEIKQKVEELTAGQTTPLAKMRALAKFVQDDIRYVAIELGIGGWQPHPAAETFSHKFGDCKDKATLMSAMLKEIGVDSYYLVVNTRRGTVNSRTPAVNWFNHVILALHLPDAVNDASLSSVYQHKTLGRLLVFDPTDELTPFGYLRGPLQANFALLVTENGGELIQLPKLAPAMNGLRRIAKLTLAPTGALTGQVTETRLGDSAAYQRELLRTVTKDQDRIKPIETVLSQSLANFRVTKASLINLNETNQPFGFEYSFTTENYSKPAGNLLLLRPRVLGNESSDLLETKEPRKFPVEFEGPSLSLNNYEITLPPGYEVDDLPPPVDVDYGFAAYHSKTEVSGNVLKYTRSFEVKDVTVPVEKADQLKRLYRIIATDERNTAILKPRS